MATLTYSNALLPLAGTDTKEQVEAKTQGFVARFMAAMMESRRRAAEREISRLELVYGYKLRPDTKTEADLASEPLPFNR